MELWLVFALMTAATIFAVLWPLARRKPVRHGSDIAVYKDQLDEIQRDRASGLIGEAEAEAARVEVSRRLIAAADAAEFEKPALEATSLWRRRMTAIAALVALPVGAVTLYLTIGSPDMPGQPLAERAQAQAQSTAVQNMIAKVEDHVARNPDDGRAWEVLAPVYMRVGRYDDAVRAYRNVLRLNGSNAAHEADLGEALVFAANGVVTDEAKKQFDRALALDAKDVMARFYTGMAADQDGRRAEAEKIWRGLLAEAPPGAPWVELVTHALNRQAPAGAATAGNSPPPADHDADAMVERLAQRLKKDGADMEGWLQLVRSYRVLNRNDKMEVAIADARKALAGDAGKLAQFEGGLEAAKTAAPMPTAAAPTPDTAAQAPQHEGSIDAMVARLAERLKKNGSDPQGWAQLVRSYRVLGQFDKAQAAVAEARKALANDPEKLRQFNEGNQPAASMPAAPAAPPAGMPGPSAADIAAASKMNPDAQNQMIRGMVARLADQLKQDGNDVAGWERLLRAYMVLGDHDKAKAAAADARKALAGDPDKLRRLDEVIKDLKVEG